MVARVVARGLTDWDIAMLVQGHLLPPPYVGLRAPPGISPIVGEQFQLGDAPTELTILAPPDAPADGWLTWDDFSDADEPEDDWPRNDNNWPY